MYKSIHLFKEWFKCVRLPYFATVHVIPTRPQSGRQTTSGLSSQKLYPSLSFSTASRKPKSYLKENTRRRSHTTSQRQTMTHFNYYKSSNIDPSYCYTTNVSIQELDYDKLRVGGLKSKRILLQGLNTLSRTNTRH